MFRKITGSETRLVKVKFPEIRFALSYMLINISYHLCKIIFYRKLSHRTFQSRADTTFDMSHKLELNWPEAICSVKNYC